MWLSSYFYGYRSVYPRNHCPLPLHGRLAEFRRVPLPARRRRDAQVYRYKAEARGESLVHRLSLGRAQDSQAQVYRALRRVMRADYTPEQRVSGHSVFLEREQVVVAIVLDARGKDEDGDADDGAQCSRKEGHLDIVEGRRVGK